MSYCKMHKKIRNNNLIGFQLSLDSHLQRCYMQCFKRGVAGSKLHSATLPSG